MTTDHDQIQKTLNGYLASFEHAKISFTESFAINPNHAFGYEASRVMLAQARAEIAMELLDLDNSKEANFAERLTSWRKRALRNLDTISFENRSTSAMSNLVQDANTKAKLDFLAFLIEETS